jgi:hypothetical protein
MGEIPTLCRNGNCSPKGKRAAGDADLLGAPRDEKNRGPHKLEDFVG